MSAAQPQRLNLTKTRTRQRRDLLPPLDWAAGHGPISGAVSATTTAAALALAGAAAHMPAGWPLVIGAAGSVGHGIGHSIARRLTGRTLVARTASWLLAGGWTSWAIASGPLSWTALGSLVALGVGISAMASSAAIHEEATEEEQHMAQARAAGRNLDSRREQIAREWEDRIRRVCGIQVTVFAVEFWATGAGYSLAADLPAGAATWDRIQTHARALAADAKLPLGCTVGVEEGDRQGRVVLDITTENVMAGSYDYPEDLAALSILTGVPWGLLPNSDPVKVYLREACALILGPPGSGKSTFSDAVLAGFARCVDVLTWVIDLKAGALGRPWVRPWLEATGRVPAVAGAAPAPKGTRPGVDWLASTPAEALLMVNAALAINAARQATYQELMDRADTTLLPVSARIPQIELVVDEGAELLSAGTFGNEVMRDLQAGVKKLMRTTRAMGIRMVLTAVDGNVSALGDTSVRKFSPVGVALTSGESSGNNMAKLFQNAKVDTRQLNAKGCGVIGAAGADGFAPVGFKGWKTSPALVRRVVLATDARRPALDAPSAAAAGTAYAERWTEARAGWLWNATATSSAPATATPRPGGLNLSSFRDQAAAAPVDDADALAARLMDDIDREFGTTDEPSVYLDKPEAPSGLNLSSLRDETAVTTGGPEWLAEAMAAIYEAGPAGMKVSAIAERVGRDRKTVRNALQAVADKGELIYRDNGPQSVYVHPDHA